MSSNLFSPLVYLAYIEAAPLCLCGTPRSFGPITASLSEGSPHVHCPLYPHCIIPASFLSIKCCLCYSGNLLSLPCQYLLIPVIRTPNQGYSQIILDHLLRVDESVIPQMPWAAAVAHSMVITRAMTLRDNPGLIRLREWSPNLIGLEICKKEKEKKQ